MFDNLNWCSKEDLVYIDEFQSWGNLFKLGMVIETIDSLHDCGYIEVSFLPVNSLLWCQVQILILVQNRSKKYISE